MGKELLLSTLGIIAGLIIGIIVQVIISPKIEAQDAAPFIPLKKHVVGFLPYWLLDKADNDYSPYLTTLTYFAVTLEEDGHIMTKTSEQESEPGWYALTSGKADPHLSKAKEDGMDLSLAVFMAGEEEIGELIEFPEKHAENLLEDIVPLMKEYEFTDLNLDVESVNEASPEERMNFTIFTKTLKEGLDDAGVGTLSIDISPTAFIKPYLVDPEGVEPYIDTMIVMGYDYHWPGSTVTGAVAPLYGYGTFAEFDVATSITEAKKIIPAHKLILGIPLYGYGWETIDTFPRAATMPSSGTVASNRRVEELLTECDQCERGVEKESEEAYVIYPNNDTELYHQIFYPDKQATQVKVQFVKNEELGGLALWALGYEGKDMLEPLKDL
ncbi:MAG: glycoside hydrolase family 18 protein [bacterium]|nr:glycoside hydrolase family 18 protein [bacterium]